jgi:hypothetical protein
MRISLTDYYKIIGKQKKKAEPKKKVQVIPVEGPIYLDNAVAAPLEAAFIERMRNLKK